MGYCSEGPGRKLTFSGCQATAVSNIFYNGASFLDFTPALPMFAKSHSTDLAVLAFGIESVDSSDGSS